MEYNTQTGVIKSFELKSSLPIYFDEEVCNDYDCEYKDVGPGTGFEIWAYNKD